MLKNYLDFLIYHGHVYLVFCLFVCFLFVCLSVFEPIGPCFLALEFNSVCKPPYSKGRKIFFREEKDIGRVIAKRVHGFSWVLVKKEESFFSLLDSHITTTCESSPASSPTCVYAKSLQSCLTLCDPVDCSSPGSSVQGFSRQEYWSGLPRPPAGVSSWPRDGTCISCLLRWQVGSLPLVPPGKPKTWFLNSI